MQLTRYTDYSLRLLMALGLHPGSLSTIQEVSDLYGVSRNHLVKIVHHLTELGVVGTVRGRNGGIRLIRPPAEVGLGDLVRAVEPTWRLAECFGPEDDRCVISSVCRLRPVLVEALEAFYAVLDGYTLADLLDRPEALRSALRPAAQGARRSIRQLPPSLRE